MVFSSHVGVDVGVVMGELYNGCWVAPDESVMSWSFLRCTNYMNTCSGGLSPDYEYKWMLPNPPFSICTY